VTTSVATFGFLHGAWHDPFCWRAVRERLEALGHRTTAPDLPLHDPDAGYQERVQPALDALDAAEDPVVVVAHSQSSAFGALVAAERPVSLLVYICPRMGTFEPPSEAPGAFREGIAFPSPRADGTTVWGPEAALEVMYPRLPAETARGLVQHLRPMAMPPDDFPLHEHPDVPTALIYATEDELFEPSFERFMARELLGIDPIEIPGGHFPMAEDPESLAELLDGLARDQA
jgi:pimeloyl-ACP methyl ester carboxylesterase